MVLHCLHAQVASELMLGREGFLCIGLYGLFSRRGLRYGKCGKRHVWQFDFLRKGGDARLIWKTFDIL